MATRTEINLKGKTVTVGVTGGIAAYKACEIVSRLVKEGADVHVAMTENAAHFVAPLTFETLSKNRVVMLNFDEKREWEVEHISLAKKTDIAVLAPCTANVVGKLACGIADDFLTTTVMAMRCPVIVAPAMNTAMYESDAYAANAETLKKRGFIFIEPTEGLLACGDTGKGRMAEPIDIVELVKNTLYSRADFAGKRVVITAGATREPIDAVRFITNRSSGKMGLSIARAAAERGAEVTVIAGFVTEPIDSCYRTVRVSTTEEMLAACRSIAADYYIMAAAPADYRAENYSAHKLKDKELNLRLVKNPDIARAVGENKKDAKLIIFCAETDDLLENSAKKLAAKHADMAVANDVTQKGAGFDCDTNIVTLLTSDAPPEKLPVMSKRELADVILDRVCTLK